MIEPTSKDIGRFVVYTDGAPVPTVEAGRISSFNQETVFVSFPKRRLFHEATVQGCRRDSLFWLDELFKAQATVDLLLRKISHGCADATCPICDKE